jgi:hypothetical protein
MQLGLKLLANATSYGVLVEIIVDERKAEIPCWVYHGGEKTERKAQKKSLNSEGEREQGFKVERPGKYFAPSLPPSPTKARRPWRPGSIRWT